MNKNEHLTVDEIKTIRRFISTFNVDEYYPEYEAIEEINRKLFHVMIFCVGKDIKHGFYEKSREKIKKKKKVDKK
jgi:hypothetical protein